MNHGFFGFPAKLNPSENAIKTFDASGGYTILPGTKKIHVFAIGGGGGGGAGGRAPSGSGSTGGAGGSGGAFVLHTFLVSDLGGVGQTLFITIGAGGSGGTAPTTDNTAGNPGSPGGATSVTIAGKPGILIYCEGGAAGGGGFVGVTTPTGGTGRTCVIDGMTKTASSGGNGSGIVYITSFFSATRGAGGANMLSIANAGREVAIDYWNGDTTPSLMPSPFYVLRTSLPGTPIIPGGLANSTTAPSDSQQHIWGLLSPGLGGPGGGSGASLANSGGRGFRGGGGGGGGACRDGNVPGSGGAGGNGYVGILAIY